MIIIDKDTSTLLSSSASGVMRLPAEVLEEVLSYVDDHDVINAANSSIQFNNVCQRIARKRCALKNLVFLIIILCTLFTSLLYLQHIWCFHLFMIGICKNFLLFWCSAILVLWSYVNITCLFEQLFFEELENLLRWQDKSFIVKTWVFEWLTKPFFDIALEIFKRGLFVSNRKFF